MAAIAEGLSMSSPAPQLKESWLPPELEREIFEIAAATHDIQTGVQLVLTAKRVRDWVEPMLYRVLVKCTDYPRTSPFLKHLQMDRISPSERQKLSYCRCLLLQSISVREAVIFLTACPNVTDLAMWVLNGLTEDYIPLGEVLFSMKIQRLSMRLTDVLRGTSPTPFVGSPLSKALTHLDLIETNIACGIWDWAWKLLLAIHKLTHLAVDGDNVIPIIKGVLKESKTIKLVVATTTHRDLGDLDNGEGWAGDLRFIRFGYPDGPISCWLRGTEGGEDMWVGAQKAQYESIERLKKKKESTKLLSAKNLSL